MNKKTIYMDYNATAPLCKGVMELMVTLLSETGNASSMHSAGRKARSAVEKAREQVAAMAGTHANQVTFTSGATEANNMVLKAFAGQRTLIGATEHPSVMQAAPDAEIIPVTKNGLIDIPVYEEMLDNNDAPALISIMMVNNETGVIQDIGALARLAKKKHPAVHFHSDAVQAAGKIKIDFQAMWLDYMSLSAHKMGGPQGIGALIAAPGVKNVKLLRGGSQEKHMRAGTENVAAIAGFGLAAELAVKNLNDTQKLFALRDKLETGLVKISPEIVFFCQDTPRIYNTSALSLPGKDVQTLIMALDLADIAVSSGAACSSGSTKASPAAQALQIPEEQLRGAFRISIGWDTTEKEIDQFLQAWHDIYRRIKSN